MEQGLCSKGSEFATLSRTFVCVRLYYTARGASEPFTRLGLGNPGGPRNNVDLAFLTPDGRNIDVRTLKPVVGPADGVWVRDVVASDKNQAGDGKEILQKAFSLMREISRLYPGKAPAAVVPWQVSLSHGIFVSAWDSKVRAKRRIAIVPADAGTETALGDADLLRRIERHYVFVKLATGDVPPELQEAVGKAGPGGIVVLDAARSVDGFGAKQLSVARTYPDVLASKAGPHTKASALAFLEKHAAR